MINLNACGRHCFKMLDDDDASEALSREGETIACDCEECHAYNIGDFHCNCELHTVLMYSERGTLYAEVEK